MKKYYTSIISVLAFAFLLTSCNSENKTDFPLEGEWLVIASERHFTCPDNPKIEAQVNSLFVKEMQTNYYKYTFAGTKYTEISYTKEGDIPQTGLHGAYALDKTQDIINIDITSAPGGWRIEAMLLDLNHEFFYLKQELVAEDIKKLYRNYFNSGGTPVDAALTATLETKAVKIKPKKGTETQE